MKRRVALAGVAAMVAGALLGMPTAAMADTSSVLCTNTTYVNGTNNSTKSTNYGSAPDLVMAGSTKIAYVECVLSGLPAGATVTSATYNAFSRSVNGNHTISAYTVTNGWTENTLTWNTPAPAYNPTAISSANGNVVAGAGEWVNLNAPNVTGNGTYRYALKVSTTTDQFYASDDYTTDTTRRPKLTVNWTPAAVPPVASFTASPTSGTVPLSVSFVDTSTNSPTSWSWAFGDGGTSTAQNPSHTYAAVGTYTASLTATNGGGSNTTSQTITVTQVPAPVASFTATPTSGTAPLSVSFVDTSTGTPTSWSWAFGDGGTSTVQNPSHTYAAEGTYTASLTATNAGGSNTASQTITVTAVPATIPDEGAGWNRVYSSTFDTDNDPLTAWTKYNANTTYPYAGAYGSDPYNCPRSDQMFTQSGNLVLRMSYRNDLPDCGGVKNNVQSYPATKWYTAGAMLSSTYAAINQQITMRYRIVYTDPKVAANPADTTSVRSHDNLPMHIGNSGCWPQSGEIDYVEGTNPTTRSTFVHFGTSCSEVSPSPITGPDYTTTDFRSTWHVVRAQRLNHVVKVYIDDLTTPKWTYTGDATSVPDTLQRVVIQQECRSAGCPAIDPTTTQYTVEDQVDYMSVANFDPTTPTAPVTGYGALTFRDEMDGPVTGVVNCFADHTYPCTNTGNSGVFLEAQCYKNENVTYSGGVAVLTAKAESATCEGLNKSYTSGMLDFTGTAATAQYGVWEVKAKVPNVVGKDSVGLWPAFWNAPVGCWPPEADTMEIFGGSSTSAGGAMLVGADGKLHPKRFTTTYHLPDTTTTETDYYGPGGDGSTDWSAAYHTWTYESRPGVQRFYVDSTLVKTVARDFPADVLAKCGAGPSGQSKLLINFALRDFYSSWLPAELPASLDVDHVRYWS